jgi:hypothetical protein
MDKYNFITSFEEHEQPIEEKFMDFVSDHIPGYHQPQELGESISYDYRIDTGFQVVPISNLIFSVVNNDDLEIRNIHQRYYKIEMFMDNGNDPKLPMALTLVEGENMPGNYSFYFQVDDEVEVPAKQELVEHIMASIDDFNLRQLDN